MAGHTKITVHGQEIDLRFGLPAIKRISDKINLLTGSEEITLNLMSMVHILYAGYVNGCLANDEQPAREFKEFYNYVEERALANDLSEVKRVIDVFVQSKDVKAKEDTGEKKSPKNLIGKKSKSSASGKTGTFSVSHGANTSY